MGDCLVTWRAKLQSLQFFSQVPYGRPSPIPLAGPERRQEQAWTPALLAFPWHCRRACPAHCQLPTLGQRTQQPPPTWVWQRPAAGYEWSHESMWIRDRPKKLLFEFLHNVEPPSFNSYGDSGVALTHNRQRKILQHVPYCTSTYCSSIPLKVTLTLG